MVCGDRPGPVQGVRVKMKSILYFPEPCAECGTVTDHKFTNKRLGKVSVYWCQGCQACHENRGDMFEQLEKLAIIQKKKNQKTVGVV